jgi:uncharacterized repeat protein (TIGR01451 family)
MTMFRLINNNLIADANSRGFVRFALLLTFFTACVLPQGVMAQMRTSEPDVKPLNSVSTKSDLESVTIDDHEVDFSGVLYDFVDPDESTWFYTVTSGSSPALSHIVFEIGACMSVLDAGRWTTQTEDGLTSLWGTEEIQVGEDPQTGVDGVKFDTGLSAGETVKYYFTVDGNYAIGHIDVGIKAGTNNLIGQINGPSPSCNVPTGNIEVVKTATPDDTGTDFVFDLGGDDTGQLTITDSGTDSFTGLEPGSYTVTEQVPDGWTLTTETCAGGVDLSAGETVTCEFENERQPGEITIGKSTDPDESGETFGYSSTELGDFDITDTAAGVDATTFGDLEPGQYTVDETTVPDGWSFDGLTCSVDGDDSTTSTSGTSVTIDLAAGEAVSCTYSNERQPGTIEVVKTATPDDTGTDFVFDLSGDDTGQLTITDSGTDSFTGLEPGSYTVTEQVPDGWTLTTETCAGGVDLSAGETVTCEFTNEQLEAGISVTKMTNGDEIRDGFCDDGTIIVGEPVSWTYEVTNTGEQPLDIASIMDDAGTSDDTSDDFAPDFVDGDDGNNVLDPGETWNYAASGTAEAGEYANTVTVEAEVQGSGEQVAAKAEVGSTVESSDVSGYCGIQPDLAIEKTDEVSFVPEGESLVYTLAYENLGSADATGVTITETVPTNTTFDTGASGAGQWTCDGAAAGSECTHSVNGDGSLAAGGSGSVQFPLTVDDELREPDPETGECPEDEGFQVNNTATIADDGENGEDANPDNNQDSEDTPIATQCEPLQVTPSIKIEKTTSDQTIQAGEKATFSITVTNDGPVDLVNVAVSDPKTPDCDRQIGDLASGNKDIYICELDNVTESFTNVATVTGETEDGGNVSDEDDADVSVLRLDEPEQQHHHPIPTTSQWALILMAGLMLMLGAGRAREWTRR